MDVTVSEDNWEADTKSPDKILTVAKENDITEQEIVKAVQEAGYKIESLN